MGAQNNREFGKEVRGISPGALPMLMNYPWPGNVRELENIIERSVALATGPVIHLKDLPLDLALSDHAIPEASATPLSLKQARESVADIKPLLFSAGPAPAGGAGPASPA